MEGDPDILQPPTEPRDPVPLTTYTAFEESAVQGEGLWQEGLRPGSPSVQMLHRAESWAGRKVGVGDPEHAGSD